MNQRSLFDVDVCRNNHGGNENSEDAWNEKRLTAGADRKRILAFVQARGVEGATCDEIEQALDMSHQTASARCTELKISNDLHENGKRRTRTGSRASVLVAVRPQYKRPSYWREDEK